MTILIVNHIFDPWQELQAYRLPETVSGKLGATSVFVGSMRDFNDSETIVKMDLEYYPGMTEKQVAIIIAEAEAKWRVLDILVVHRVGQVLPNDAIVLVAAWASHRGDAFDATRYVLEALKSRAPFWKKESLSSDGTRWVGANTGGYDQTQNS